MLINKQKQFCKDLLFLRDTREKCLLRYREPATPGYYKEWSLSHLILPCLSLSRDSTFNLYSIRYILLFPYSSWIYFFVIIICIIHIFLICNSMLTINAKSVLTKYDWTLSHLHGKTNHRIMEYFTFIGNWYNLYLSRSNQWAIRENNQIVTEIKMNDTI